MAGGAQPAVRVEGIAKRFQRGERHDSLRDLIPALVRRARGRRPAPPVAGEMRLGRDEFWAVRDLSFDVEFGRALGIIGPNGAGKSTTLKLLTGILRPTAGEIRMRGRVASLIEVSAGFHQDLTGRENVYLQGAIMGMTRREVSHRLDSIIDFSGIEPFIDTPVKRYSSGMNARLGFAIAVHLDPDVLVIDEVLSVGDMSFQQKCVDRMKAFKRDGVAIVFVSHNMQAVGDLCDEALVIKGSPCFHGPVGDAVSEYLRIGRGEGAATAQGDGISFVSALLSDADGQTPTAVAPHTALCLEVELEVGAQRLSGLVFGFIVRRATDGMVVYDGSVHLSELGTDSLEPGSRLRLRFDHAAHLARGQYAYELGVFDERESRHRLMVAPIAGLRVDEYMTYSGVANLQLSASGTIASGS
jgi:lipopolysaccharide transport system ATP-binding protein